MTAKPGWATEEIEASLGARRFEFRNQYAEPWIARVEKMRVLLTGEDIDWATLQYNYDNYDHYLGEYQKEEKDLPFGYLTPGMKVLDRGEAAWMYRVLAVAKVRNSTPRDSLVDFCIEKAELCTC